MLKICRMCSVETRHLIPMVKHSEERDELDEIGSQFEDCFGIKVLATPHYTSICNSCYTKLRDFYELKLKVLSTHDKFLQEYGNVVIAEIEKDIKCEILEDSEDTEMEHFKDCETNMTIIKFEEEKNPLDISSIVAKGPNQYKLPTKPAGISSSELSPVKSIKTKVRMKTPTKFSRLKFSCKECGKLFALEETLNAHMNTHKGLPAYSCEICKKSFNQKGNLTYHMKNHNNDRQFKCGICSKAYLTQYDLGVHMRSHNNEKSCVCDICGVTLKAIACLGTHIKTHEKENLFECKICKKKLHSRQTLRGHIAAMHENCDPRLYCTLCKKQFNRRHRFISHVKIKHPDDNEEMLSKVERRVMNKFPREKYQKLEKNK